MPKEPVVTTLSRLSAESFGVFRAERATGDGVTPNQLARLAEQGVIERILPMTYRMVAVAPSTLQQLHAALLWAGDKAAAAGRSAGELYRLEGVRAEIPEIAVPYRIRARTSYSTVYHGDSAALMVRRRSGVRLTGVEATLLRLAYLLDDEAFEVACEDARRRRLTSMAALRAYLDRFGRRGRPGVASMRRLLDQLDPAYPARSTLEVKTRRLLVAHGISDFAREFPLEWNGRTYRYDFAFPRTKTILETNGRRWHDDPTDYEHDHEKWSVPGRLGYRIVFATWEKVTRATDDLVEELVATMAAR
jgi:very-short-patch-repair endonuclease